MISGPMNLSWTIEFPKFSSRFRSPLLSQLIKGFGTVNGVTRAIVFFVLPCEMTNRERFAAIVASFG
jgi:hypothetical protein